MAKSSKKADARTDPGEDEQPTELDIERSKELAGDADLDEALLELYKDVEKGYEDQWERANEAMDYWDIFNCELGSCQYYSGNSKIFLPIVHDAVNARTTRFVNQIFPQAGRFVEVTTVDGTVPHAEMSLIEHYVRKAKLRTEVMPALLRNGDIEGQYTVCVTWVKKTRHVTWRKQKPIHAEGIEVDSGEDIEQKKIVNQRPHVEVIADSDLLVLPHTSDSISDALACGGSVTLLRRWSKSKIKQMIKDEEIREEQGEALLAEMKKDARSQLKDKSKAMVDAAGIKTGTGGKHALVYETWTELTVHPHNERRLCRAFFGGERDILSCKRNPYWSDKCPVFSVPVQKVQGVFKGQSKVMPTAETQYYANDIINEAADSSMYSMMPIVMTDPEKNPRIGSMVLSLAAVWETSPQHTQFAKFPDIWKSGFEIVGSCKAQIMQTLSVSPAAITSSNTQKAKPSQADVAREQQVDILTTADAVTIVEEGILTPLVNFFIELDHQYRDDEVMVRQFGEMGLQAKMEWIPPIQMENKYAFRWFGVEQARNQMQIQQQIAALGVIMKIPPQQYQGYKLNIVPVITQLVLNAFGPRLSPQIFVDEKKMMTLDPNLENQWLAEGIELAIHPMDDDPQHLKTHQELMAQSDPTGNVGRHMQRHMFQMQMKQQAQLMAAVQQLSGGPGNAPPDGGQGGGPQPGAQPRGNRGNGQGPPGMIHRDQIGPAAGQPPALRGRG